MLSKTVNQTISSDYCLCFSKVYCIQSASPNKNIRSFCAISVRKNLSAFSEKNFTNLWNTLNAETHAQVKMGLFSCLETETEPSVAHVICDAIGEIGGSLIEPEDSNLL